MSTSKLKCPHCDNEEPEEMWWSEWVPTQRRIWGIHDGKLYANSESSEIFESGKDAHIFCNRCNSEFDPPKGMGSPEICGRHEYERSAQ